MSRGEEGGVTKAAAGTESPEKPFRYRVGNLDKIDISGKLEIAKTNQDLYHNNEGNLVNS